MFGRKCQPASADTIDWGELSSQPILKVDEPVCLKSSRRNFKILRARLEQETAENHFRQGSPCRLEGVVPTECSNSTNTNSISPYHCLGTEFRTSFRYRGTVGTFRGTFLAGQDGRTDISLDIQQFSPQ